MLQYLGLLCRHHVCDYKPTQISAGHGLVLNDTDYALFGIIFLISFSEVLGNTSLGRVAWYSDLRDSVQLKNPVD